MGSEMCIRDSIWDKLLIEGQGRQIVISSAPMIAARFLLPNLEQFSKIHKRIDFKFVSTNQITNVKNRESDIAIRLGKPPEKTLYYEELLPVSVFAVCLKSAKPKFIKNKVVSGPLIGNTFLKNEWDVFRQLYPMNMDPYVKILWFDSLEACLLYTSPSPRDLSTSRMPSSA